MSSFIIEGGHRLKGEILPQGAKNEALQVICATLLTDEEVIIENVPDILDVNNLSVCFDLGVEVKSIDKGFGRSKPHIDLQFIKTKEFIRRSEALRGSVMIVGPLLARFGEAMAPKPGGDKIGRRRIDTTSTV
jgi:UDP-N-acetylglucosamine 1-carboxyvinyltransferase